MTCDRCEVSTKEYNDVLSSMKLAMDTLAKRNGFLDMHLERAEAKLKKLERENPECPHTLCSELFDGGGTSRGIFCDKCHALVWKRGPAKQEPKVGMKVRFPGCDGYVIAGQMGTGEWMVRHENSTVLCLLRSDWHPADPK